MTLRPDPRRPPLQPLELVLDEHGRGGEEQSIVGGGNNNDQENIQPSAKGTRSGRTRVATAAAVTAATTTPSPATTSTSSSSTKTTTTTVSPVMDAKQQLLRRGRSTAQQRQSSQPQSQQPARPTQSPLIRQRSPTQSPQQYEPLSLRSLQVRKQQLQSRYYNHERQQEKQKQKDQQELNLIRQKKLQLELQEQKLLQLHHQAQQQAERERQLLLQEEQLLQKDEQRVEREKQRLEREKQLVLERELQEARLRIQSARARQEPLGAPTGKQSRPVEVEEKDPSDEKVSRARIEQDQKRAQESTEQHAQVEVEQLSPPPLQLQTSPSPPVVPVSSTRKRARDIKDEPSDGKVSRARVQSLHPSDRPVASTASAGSQSQQQAERRTDTARQLVSDIEQLLQPSQQPQQPQQQPQQQPEGLESEGKSKVKDMGRKLSISEFCKLFTPSYHYNQYEDDKFRYCLVTLPRRLLQELPPSYRQYPNLQGNLTLRLLNEKEWRVLEIRLGDGWQHYDRHDPDPRTLMFRKPKT